MANDKDTASLTAEHRKIVEDRMLEGLRNNHIETIDACLKKGGDIDQRDAGNKDRTLLHLAVIAGKYLLISNLIQRGANITLKDADGHTAYDMIKSATATEDVKSRMRDAFFEAVPSAPAGSLRQEVTPEFNDSSEAATTRPVRVVAKINLKPNEPVL